MTEKYFKSRIVHKHDIAENWLKATTFIPLKGELVVYDIDETHSYERFKIGDGKTLVNDLPFADDALKDFVNNTYATKTEVDSAINNTHTHSNKSVLDGITSTQVSNWNAAEQNAKNYASNLNSSMDSRVQALESIDFEAAAQQLLAESKAYTDANSFKVKQVNSLPATGDKSTIYVQDSEEFIWAEKLGNGTPVPNDGTFVENIYFNTSLNVDEVKAICNSINGWVDISESQDGSHLIYLLAATGEGEKTLGIMKVTDIFVIVGVMSDSDGNPTEVFLWQSASLGEGSSGWQGIDSYHFNGTAVDGSNIEAPMIIGSENDKLANLFSITPFDKNISKTTIPTPPHFIDTICFDTSKSIEETNAILEQLTYPVNMEMYYEKGYTVALWGEIAEDIVSSKNAGILQIRRAIYPASPDVTRYFIEWSSTSDLIRIYDIDNGWQVDKIEAHSALSGSFNVLDGIIGNLADAGTQNELLKELMWNEKVESEGVWEKLGHSSVQKVSELPQEGEFNTLYIVENNDKYDQYIWVESSVGGTPVPNSTANAEELGYWYWNSFASTDEVVSAFKKLTYVEVEDGVYVYHVLVSASQPGENWVIQYTKSTDSYVFYRTNTDPTYTEKDLVFTSKPFPDGFNVTTPFAGWQLFNPSGENFWFDIPTNEYQGRPVGMENDKLASIFSMTPFEGPAFVPNGSAPVPKDGSYVEKIYFNTSITFEEFVVRFFNLPSYNSQYESRYDIVQNGLKNKGLSLVLMPYAESSIFVLCDNAKENIYYLSMDLTHPSTGETLKAGWQVDSIDWNDNTSGYVDSTIDFQGSVNDWLVDIISITPNFAIKQDINSSSFAKITPSLEGYATEEYVNNAIANIPGVDLSDYATKDEIPSLKLTTISLPASSWTGSASPYSQVVSVTGATQNSKIDLQPTIAQLSEMILNGLSMQAVNENGVVTVYVVGEKPTINYSMQALITEVEVG